MFYQACVSVHQAIALAVGNLNQEVKGNYIAKWGSNGVPVSGMAGFEHSANRVKVIEIYLTYADTYKHVLTLQGSPSSIELCNITFVWDPKVNRIKYKELTAFLTQAFVSQEMLDILPA